MWNRAHEIGCHLQPSDLRQTKAKIILQNDPIKALCECIQKGFTCFYISSFSMITSVFEMIEQ